MGNRCSKSENKLNFKSLGWKESTCVTFGPYLLN